MTEPDTTTTTATYPNRPKRSVVRRVFKFAAIAFAVLAMAYGVLCWWYYSHEPRLTRNYAAELNAPILKVPPEKRAWTHYRRALERLEPRQENEFAEGPGDKDWPATAAYLKRNAEALAMIHAAAKMRPLGVVLQDGIDPADVAWRVRHHDLTEEEANETHPPSENPCLIGLPFPYMSPLLDVARLLQSDIQLAAIEDDGKRATADLMAMFDVAEQAMELRFFVGQMVATTIEGMALAQLDRTLTDSPTAFSDDQLASLEARLQQVVDNDTFRFHMDGERTLYDDYIQRFYADDGKGDGVFMLDADFAGPEKFSRSWWWDRFRAPVYAAFIMPGRRELLDANEHYFRDVERILEMKPWDRNAALEEVADEFPLYAAIRRWDGEGSGFSGHYAWSLDDLDHRLKQQHGATLAAIALVRHHRSHQQWPANLAQLTPALIREVPLDQFTGKPLLYNVLDGRPVVYSVGADLNDDGGQPPGPGYPPMSAASLDDLDTPPNGDWILWPPLKSDQEAAPADDVETPLTAGDDEPPVNTETRDPQ